MKGPLFTCILCRDTATGFTTYYITKRILFSFFLIYFQAAFPQCGAVALQAGIISDLGNGPGVVAWTNPADGTFADNKRTVASFSVYPGVPEYSHFLYARNFNFAVPANASVCGIEVVLERRKQGGTGTSAIINDYSVELVSGTMVAANYAKSLPWSDTDKVIVYGGSTDCWGKNWTPANINQSSFGVNIVARLQAGSGPVTLSAEIDHIYIMVYYSSVLPVELMSFNAETRNGREVELNWSTATETNSERFVIERSRDAAHFEPVAELKASGNSLSANYYHAVDSEPYDGLSYYRLKQVDFNGTITVFPGKPVTLGQKKSMVVTALPDYLSVRLNTDQFAARRIELVNAQGRVMWSTYEIPESGQVEVRIQTAGMATGVYLVRAMTPAGADIVRTHIAHE